MNISPSVSLNESTGIAFGTYNNDDYWSQGIFWKRTGSYGLGELHLAVRSTADTTTVSIADSALKIEPNKNATFAGNGTFAGSVQVEDNLTINRSGTGANNWDMFISHHGVSDYGSLFIDSNLSTGNFYIRDSSNNIDFAVMGDGLVSIGAGRTPKGILDVRRTSSKVGFGTSSSANYGEIYFGSGVAINFAHETNGNAGGIINYRGYDNGVSQFRDLTVMDGKGGTVAFFDGSAKRIGINNSAPTMELEIHQSTLLHGGNVGIRLYAEDDNGTARDGHIIFDPDTQTVGLSKDGSAVDLGVTASLVNSVKNMYVDTGGTSRITIDGNNTSGDDGNLQIYGYKPSGSRAYISINNGVYSGGEDWYIGALRGSNSFAIGRNNDFGTDTDFYINSSGIAYFGNNVQLGDSKALTLGADDDAQIWSDGSNTYIRNNISNQDIIFQVNDGGVSGVEVFRIDASISSTLFKTKTEILTDTSPAFKVADASGDSQFQVNINASDGGEIAVNDGGGNEKIRFSARSGGNSYINTAGSFGFGIGTNAPTDYYSKDLVISCPDNGGITLASGNTSHASCIMFADGTSGNAQYQGQMVYDHNVDAFGIWTASNNALWIDQYGNTGIGTIAPTDYDTTNHQVTSLVLAGAWGGRYDNKFGSNVRSSWYHDTSQHTYFGSIGDYNLTFIQNSNTAMVIDGNSNISLGNNDSSGVATNTIFGYQTGNAIASGAQENTLFGYQSGLLLTTGDYNTAIGAMALKTDKLGRGTTAIGTSAVFSQEAGSEDYVHNTGVGMVASYYNVTGVKNTAVGSYAMFGASGNSHSLNTAVGFEALKVVTTGGSNVAIGAGSGKDTTEGTENVYIGTHAGENAVGSTHSWNVMIGYQAGKNLAHGKNVGIGHKAYYNGAGDSNLAIGYHSMGAGSVSGYSNQAIGRQSLENLTGGDQNVAIGEQALQENQMGNELIGIGNQALRDCNGGVQNIAIGFQSQRDHNAGDYNTSVGWKTLSSDTGNGNDNTAFGAGVLANFVADTNAHGQNTAIGSYSCNSNVTGTYNTTVGAYTSQYATDGDHNVMIGYTAGKFDDAGNNVTSPDQCVVIGSLAETDTATPTNEIVIGYGTHGQGDNTATLGNADVTNVYMAQDSGATVHAGKLTLSSASPIITMTDTDDNSDGRIVNDAGVLTLDADLNNEVSGSSISLRVDGAVEVMNVAKGEVKIPAKDLLVGADALSGTKYVKLHGSAHGQIDIGGDITTLDTKISFIDPNGSAGAIKTANGATQYTSASDYRLKENEVTLPDGLTRLEKLKPYRFNFKTHKDKTVDGFFAHEVAEIVPQAVSGEKDAVDSDGNIDIQGIDQSKLVPLLVKAVQELSAKVKELEAKV